MKSRWSIVASLLLLVLGATEPRAAGINLSWDDCGSGGVLLKEFACAENEGDPFTLVASFVPPAGVTNMEQLVAEIWIDETATEYPDWWKFGSICRSAADLAASLDYLSTPVSCETSPASYAVVSQTYFYQPGGRFSDAHSELGVVVSYTEATHGVSVSPDVEYFAFKVHLARSKSTGAGSCIGCPSPMSIELQKVTLVQSPLLGFSPQLTTAQDRKVAYWQAKPLAISPSLGGAGTLVTLTGEGLTGATAVTFSGQNAPYSVVSDAVITTEVPPAARSGNIRVEAPGGPSLSPTFTCPPVVQRISPMGGPVGSFVRFDGYNFNSLYEVIFTEGAAATPFGNYSDSMWAQVPYGATTGPIIVGNTAGLDTTEVFVVTTTDVQSSNTPTLELRSIAWSQSEIVAMVWLPSEQPFVFEVFDPVGRRWLSRELAGSAGEHRVVVSAMLPTGAYFGRVRQGGSTVKRSFFVIR